MLPFRISRQALDMAAAATDWAMLASRRVATLPLWYKGPESQIQINQNMLAAQNTVKESFLKAQGALDLAEKSTHRLVFENRTLASAIGDNFAGVPITNIQPAFRLKDMDACPAEIAADYKKSGFKNIVILIAGLFCDEGLWQKGDDPLADIFIKKRIYPIYFRFNPGVHVSTNGKALLELCNSLAEQPEMKNRDFSFITYSLGGLILRSALYYDQHTTSSLRRRIKKAIFINSPDGGSYLEKLGFLLALGLKASFIPALISIGHVGDQRSDGIKDLSHGIIREEDWQSSDHFERYGAQKYFGELNGIDAIQIYSLINRNNSIASYMGDGIVETGSLTYLTERVFKPAESHFHKRVYTIDQHDHFSVLTSSDLRNILKKNL